ncbi:MAG: metallophosphoesterase [Bacteroidales bacterium]|jgi:hypothetical protein|nr:metallophosphoesterase [Bacteroidales bacterium]
MLIPAILLAAEFLSPEVLRQHYYSTHRPRFYITSIIHVILSIWLWLLWFEVVTFNSFFDSPSHIWRLMALNGSIAAVVVPRIVLVIFHFTGKLVRIRTGGHIRWLTDTGLVFMGLIFLVTTAGSLLCKFNFKTEEVKVKIEGLHPDLEGLRIVQVSDLHLASYAHHSSKLVEVVEAINSLDADLLINTGDFITFGWREFGQADTILVKARSRHGSFAVSGNHDTGGYHPYFTEAEERDNVLIMKELIRKSGYNLLYDNSETISIGDARVSLIGITTRGSHPDIEHGDLAKAIQGTDSADFRILLSHDPNHFQEQVEGKTNIELTLSGHTHGMQIGILTKSFRWSPAKYMYPHWNGLYGHENQWHYVNRGLGVLGLPFRIWMPPEITIITVVKK